MEQKYIKKGQLLESKDGDLSLVNTNYKSYPVDRDVIDVWSRLDGVKTVEEVAFEIGEARGKSVEDITPHVSLLVKELSNIDLVTDA